MRHNGRGLRRDDAGQMMMLSAVLLLIGFVALAGMVARVNQLGTQTTTESRKSVLAESGPLQDALDGGLSALAKRTASATVTSGSVFITASAPVFSATDVGLFVSDPGAVKIPAGTKITAVSSATAATMSNPGSASGTVTITLRRAGFSLDTTTTPTLDTAVVSFLEELRKVEAEHGLLMGYDIPSDATGGAFGSSCASTKVVVRLADGDVKVQIQSTVAFARAGGCADIQGSFFPFP